MTKETSSVLNEHTFDWSYLTEDIRERIDKLVSHYPQKRAVLAEALWAIQEKYRCIPFQAQLELAHYLDIPPVWIMEVMTFYSLFRQDKPGDHHIAVCESLSCALHGSHLILKKFLEKLKVGCGERTPDGRFSIEKVACLGACEHAPVLLINGTYIGNVDEALVDAILENPDDVIERRKLYDIDE